MHTLILPYQLPDAEGHFGPFGGVFVPETLMPAIEQLGQEYEKARNDPEFSWKLGDLLRTYCGRPTPLYFAERLTKELGGPLIYLKREDLLHTGAHKINNAIGQALLARMEFLGATVVPVSVGQATLKEAINEAMRDWVTNVRNTHYLLGTAYGPHPYPMMVRDFHRIIGEEARRQILAVEEKLPDLLVACVGGGSNAIGLFYPFLEDENVRMVGVEAGGRGIRPGEHAARFQAGCLGVLQGTKTFLLCDADGQIQGTHSISAGLDYAAVGPEHSYLREIGRVEYSYATDEEALAAFQLLAKTEGILAALESTHALAYLIKRASEFSPSHVVVINLSGRGDKDVQQLARLLQKTT